jgi:hypothetical protein
MRVLNGIQPVLPASRLAETSSGRPRKTDKAAMKGRQKHPRGWLRHIKSQERLQATLWWIINQGGQLQQDGWCTRGSIQGSCGSQPPLPAIVYGTSYCSAKGNSILERIRHQGLEPCREHEDHRNRRCTGNRLLIQNTTLQRQEASRMPAIDPPSRPDAVSGYPSPGMIWGV